MANTGYGQYLYGQHRYGGWPGGAGRPYGIGAYGTGPYARYGANVFVMGGHSGILFTPKATAPPFRLQFHMASGITFNVSALGMVRISQSYAATQIMFTTHTHLTWSWNTPNVCSTGTWTQTLLVDHLVPVGAL